VAKNEEGDSRICGQVCHMSAGESGASTTGWRITISSDSRMEMGEYHYGFCICVPTPIFLHSFSQYIGNFQVIFF
jgi:hypothetical protein